MSLREDFGYFANDAVLAPLVRAIGETVREHASVINRLVAGRIAAHPTATAAPTGGSWTQGDFVRNSTPTEQGSASSKYVVIGYSCVASGTPGTWVECRCLTGN